MNELLTIVIPCKNEGYGVIKAIKQFEGEYQVIVADSSDDNTTNKLLKQYASNTINTKIVKGGLPAIARNRGAKSVITPHILFLDADVYLEDLNQIRECLEQAINNDYDLVTCKFKTDRPYRWIYRLFDLIQWFTSISKPFSLGGFMLFKTETFNKLGGFNEEDKIAEDYHLSSKIRPNKFKIVNHYVYTPSRRFQKKDVWYMTKLAVMSWINRNNDDFFKKDYNYWK